MIELFETFAHRKATMKTFNLNEVHNILTSRGINAVIAHTGGGVFTLFAGQPAGEDGDYPFAVGPAYADGSNTYRTDADDTYGGPADEGEHTPVLFTEDHTDADIADLIEAAVKGEVTFPTSEEQASPQPYVRPSA